MIFIIIYLLFIIWLSLTIKNKTKNLYNADLAKKVHMYKYIWMFILVIIGVVKTIRFVSTWWLLLVLVVLKEYIILVLRIILFRIYYEIKKIHNFETGFSFQQHVGNLFGINNLVRYIKLKKNLIKLLKVVLPLVLLYNKSTIVILLLILVLMDLKSQMFSPLMDCASINMHYEYEIILNPYGKHKVKQYHNNLMHCRVVNYRKNNQGVIPKQDFVFKKNWLNNE